MYAWSPRTFDPGPSEHDFDFMRRAAMSSFRILRTTNRDELWERIVEEVGWWLEASAVRAFRMDDQHEPSLVSTAVGGELPPDAALMEASLLIRALGQGRSLISNHPQIAPELVPLSESLERSGSVVHVLLLRAFQESHGAVAVHWLGAPRPSYERRSGFLSFWDNAGVAVALDSERERIAREREVLLRAAYYDTKTGLPNQAALERELAAHAETLPLGVVVADFDGMREANKAFDDDYARGGDVLIRAVGVALERFAGPGEFAARMNTAGDEFCLLVPGADEAMAQRRAEELECTLDTLEVPASHRHVYRGASVGGVARLPEETPGQALGRASTAMRDRKLRRQSG
jgi:diguanylate cyclase (GGDEF)-like protein